MVLDGNDIYGYIFPGRRFDIGNKIDWLKANIELSLQDEEIGNDLKEWLDSLRE